MTGFGSAFASFEGAAGARRLDVEVRSVNARYLEVRAKHPFDAAVGDRVVRCVKGRLGRGRVEVQVALGEADGAAAPQPPPAAALDAACNATKDAMKAAERAGLALREVDPCELVRLARGYEDARDKGHARVDAPACLDATVDGALIELEKMRAAEGAVVERALREQVEALRRVHREVCAGLSQARSEAAEGLRARAQEWLEALAEGAIDESRLLVELATQATRGDVTEEVDRIASHLDQLEACLDAPASRGQGKTLDFLCQELGRELTTTGSKLTSATLCATVIEGKGALERLREQVQNVE